MSAAVPVGVGTRFAYNGEILTVVQMFPSKRGNEVLVADRAGMRRYWINLRELLAGGLPLIITDDGSPRSDDPVEVASVILSNLSDAERKKVSETAGHVREVLTGYKSGTAMMALPREPRRQYTVGVPLEKRYAAKAAELGCSIRTIERWIAAYRDHGEAGLISPRASDPFGATDRRWIRAAAQIMVEHSGLSKPSRLSVIRQTNARMTLTYGAEVVPEPSQATAYRVLSILERQIPTFALSAKRNREIAARPDGEYGKLRPTRPGEYLVMDSTRLDVFALDPATLKWASVDLTIAMDWYSRCITGLRLSPTTKAADVAAVLYQTFKPPPAPAHWPPEAVWPEHGVPRVVFPAVEFLTGDTSGMCHPAVVPETLVIDHGKAFKAQHVSSVCQRLGISIQPARIRTGRDKGVIERFFRTLREDLLQVLPGYKGPDVYSRGESPELETFFYVDELEEIIRHYVAVVYHNRPHDGLVEPGVPGLKMSPAEMFEHGVARAGFIEAPCDPDLAFEFLKAVNRHIFHYGIDYNGRRYNGPGLDPYRNSASTHTGQAGRQWPIHVNPDDVTRVYFRDPESRKWHTLRWTALPDSPFQFDEDTIKYARRLAVAEGRSTDPAAAMEALLSHWNLDLGKSVAGRRIALKLSRERATLMDGLVTDDDPVDATAGKTSDESSQDIFCREESNDDLSESETEGSDEDEFFDEVHADDEYYADAFEDGDDI
jgi:transposase InsO family protein